MYKDLTQEAQKIICEFTEAAKLRPGQLMVIGCSSSEIAGVRIGKGAVWKWQRPFWQGSIPT